MTEAKRERMIPFGKTSEPAAIMHSISSRTGINVSITRPQALGAGIRAGRKTHQLTQAQLAGLAGVGVRFVSELERGKPGTEIGKMLDVLAVLGLRLWLTDNLP